MVTTILDNSGRYLGTMDAPAERPAGPWSANRGRDIREALAGELPRAVRESETVARMNAAHPGASWHFVTHPTVGRILVSVPDDAPISPELVAELESGRRA